MLAVGGDVGAVGVNLELKDAEGMEVYGVVLYFFSGAVWTEGELLAEEDCAVGDEGELLHALRDAVCDVNVDMKDGLRGVEDEAKGLGAGGGGSPAGSGGGEEGVVDGEEVVGGGDFDFGEGGDVEPRHFGLDAFLG